MSARAFLWLDLYQFGQAVCILFSVNIILLPNPISICEWIACVLQERFMEIKKVMKEAEISSVLIWNVWVTCSGFLWRFGESLALLLFARGSTADRGVKWSRAVLNCSPLSAVFSKPPPDDYGLCLPT